MLRKEELHNVNMVVVEVNLLLKSPEKQVNSK